ncbi:hypothetical protein BS50DRAFT_576527 [Corynespora cassiicola Philippines]|uniref:TPR-like protein n=1 Tax=Corynespora cassiicola Philippines TaxID=1448308 RepID=A0A2T2NEN2_CORCC|nr:hypothetical protein BS50DRAFT_576527 [Corynespora cassiicola Philippines]
MPRASVPNGRFLATADSPILPFLAPRVFAESPIQRKSPHRDGPVTQSKRRHQECKESQAVDKIRCRNSACQNGPSGSAMLGASHPSKTVHLHQASTLGHSSSNRPYRKELKLSPVDLRYLDISMFARQQSRCYATGTSPTSGAATASSPPDAQHQRHRLIRRVVPKPSMVRKRNIRLPRRTHTREVWEKLRRRKKGLSKRKKGVILHLGRLITFLSYFPKLGDGELLKRGKFRSMRRRLFNFERLRPESVDMTRIEKTGAVSFGHMTRVFAALDYKAYPGIKKNTLSLCIKHIPQCEEWVDALLRDVEPMDTKQMYQNWIAQKEEDRAISWIHILVWLLDHQPDRALQFVHVLASGPSFNRGEFILADSLEHIARYFTKRSRHGASDMVVASFYPIFRDVFSRHLIKFRGICSQDLLMNIAQLATVEDLTRIFNLLLDNNAFIEWPTLLHYANVFGKAGNHHQALRCLHRIARIMGVPAARKQIVASKDFVWTCAAILRGSMKNRGYHESTTIVSDFVKLGVKFDVLLYNVIISNAMEAGDYATAFQVYNNLEEHGLKPDKYTYSILLHGCYKSHEPAKFHEFAEHCAEMAITLNDPWLATDYLCYVFFRYRQRVDAEKFEAILAHAYCRFFSAKPLLSLSTILPGNHLQSAANEQTGKSSSEYFTPPAPALHLMIQAWIRLAGEFSSKHVWELYVQFRKLVRDDPEQALVDLAKAPVVWNAFLHAFCQKQQFADASLLMKDLIDHGPRPNVFSFNIFMQAFFRTGQLKAAERMQGLMQIYGVEPDEYTYGVMVRGYAKAQLAERVGEIMDHVSDEDQLDPQLLQLLGKIVNRQSLLKELDMSKKRKEAKERELFETENTRWIAPEWFPLDLHALHRDEGESSRLDENENPHSGASPSESVYSGLGQESKQLLSHDAETASSQSIPTIVDELLPTIENSPLTITNHRPRIEQTQEIPEERQTTGTLAQPEVEQALRPHAETQESESIQSLSHSSPPAASPTSQAPAKPPKRSKSPPSKTPSRPIVFTTEAMKVMKINSRTILENGKPVRNTKNVSEKKKEEKRSSSRLARSGALALKKSREKKRKVEQSLHADTNIAMNHPAMGNEGQERAKEGKLESLERSVDQPNKEHNTLRHLIERVSQN